MSINDYRAEERAARAEAAKAVEEACKAIEACAAGDAAAIAEHFSAAEEHADNAQRHAKKAHTYAADEAAREATNAAIEAEMAISELAYTIGEAIADEANATNAERRSAHSAAFAELTAQPWTATAKDRNAVAAMVETIAEQARENETAAREAAAREAAARVIDAYAEVANMTPADDDYLACSKACYAVAADEIMGSDRATVRDAVLVSCMVYAIAR